MTWTRSQGGHPATKGTTLYRVIVLLSLSATLFGVLPLVTGAIAGGVSAVAQLPILSDWHVPVFRSLVLMVTCAPLCLVTGFLLGSRLADSRRRIGVGASLLLLPMLLGGGVNAFVFKLCFTDIAPVAKALQNR